MAKRCFNARAVILAVDAILAALRAGHFCTEGTCLCSRSANRSGVAGLLK
jgi:hypothetical protein